jgi:hypothetical protein
MRKTPIKKRDIVCYEHKKHKLTKKWKRCPKIQSKYSLEEWLKQIKLPNKNDK